MPGMNGKYLSPPPSSLYYTSISTDGIIVAINSRGSFSYANYNNVCDKMNFSSPPLLITPVMDHWFLDSFPKH